jgi:hypothetical protein
MLPEWPLSGPMAVSGLPESTHPTLLGSIDSESPATRPLRLTASQNCSTCAANALRLYESPNTNRMCAAMDFNPTAMPVRFATGEIHVRICLHHTVASCLVLA